MICKHILKITFLNKFELFFCAQLNVFKYCYISLNLTSIICLQSGPESNGNEDVLPIPQISKVGDLLSDGFMSYPEQSLSRGV